MPMALGLSGSNGGIQEMYTLFVLADVSSAVKKYESLYKNIPPGQEQTRTFYEQVITGLHELKENMTEILTEGLEARL